MGLHSVAYGEHWPLASLQRMWCLVHASNEILGSVSLMISLVDNISQISHLFAGGVKHVLCDPNGRGLMKTCAWLRPVFVPCAFSLC